MLLGYRIVLPCHRLQSNGNTSISAFWWWAPASIGQEIVSEFKRQQWPGIEFVGFVDTALLSKTRTCWGYRLGKLEDTAECTSRSCDEIIVALPEAHTHLANKWRACTNYRSACALCPTILTWLTTAPRWKI
ncbi:MAG: hypothetical protein H6641_15225 [Caldilineaceae bacterium]|nr:hypothetical protein [Caldilineaceae bacterium]